MASTTATTTTTAAPSSRRKVAGPKDLRSYTIALHDYTTHLWLQARENAERQAKTRADRSEKSAQKQKRNASSHR